MTAWLVRFEAFPEYFTRTISGYRGWLSRDVLVADSWMKISFRGTDIGYTHASIDINENNTLEHYVLNNRVHVAFNLSGSRKNVHALASVYLDTSHNLRRFTFSFSAPGTIIKVEGKRIEGDFFDVLVKTDPGTEVTRRIQIPPDIVLYSPLTDTVLKQLKPGQQITIRTFDPISLKKSNILVNALRREMIMVSKEQVDAIALSSEYHGIKVFSWINDNGVVLRQESPIGWSMQRCTPEEAYDAALETQKSDDVLRAIIPLLFLSEKIDD